MASVDMYNNIFAMNALNGGTYTTSFDGFPIDTQGFESITFIMQMALITDGLWLFYLEDSNEIAGTYALVEPPYRLGTNPTVTGASDNQVFRLGYVGNKRFVRVSLDLTGAGTANFGAVAILGTPRSAQTPVQPNQV